MRSTKEPKITVIIPTRERCDVLEKSLKTVTSQDYGNLEIIVSDNCSCDGTRDVVLSTNDERLKYLNTGKRVSMSHNWEFALSHVTDGWITIIGDDDGLLPESLNKVSKIIRSTDIQAIRSSVCSYSWPSLIGKDFGRLGIPLKSGCEVRDSKIWLTKVMNGHASYPELPMLYNGGFVDMRVLEKIKRKSGAIYLSCIPDVYSAISISSAIKNYIYSNEPLAINGGSKHSTGTSYFAVENKSEQTPAEKFRTEKNIAFHKDVPICADGSHPPSIQAIVYESFLQSAILRNDFRESMHQQQLELILATSNRLDVDEWGKLFASIHGLDYDGCRYRAKRRRIFLRLTSALDRISNAFNTFGVGSSDFPITDVYAASIAAAEIRNHLPGPLKRIRRLAGRAIEEIVGS